MNQNSTIGGGEGADTVLGEGLRLLGAGLQTPPKRPTVGLLLPEETCGQRAGSGDPRPTFGISDLEPGGVAKLGAFRNASPLVFPVASVAKPRVGYSTERR